MTHQRYGVRTCCSKGGPEPDGVADVVRAVGAAARGEDWMDKELNHYMPQEGLRPIGDLLFSSTRRTRIWRALALGASTHKEVAQLTGSREKTPRNEMSGTDMVPQLAELDPGIGIPPLAVLSSYATRNWPVFLDDTVVKAHPYW